jgi:hypothetical protein
MSRTRGTIALYTTIYIYILKKKIERKKEEKGALMLR